MLDIIGIVQTETEVPQLLPEEFLSQPDQSIAEVDQFSSRHVASIAMAHGVHDLYSGFLPPLLAILIEQFGLTNLGGGSLTLFYSLPSLFQPLIGSMADQHNLKILISLAPLITGTVMSLLGLATTPALMMAMLVLAGLSSASLHAIGPALNSKHAGKKLGRGMSFWVNAGSLGYAFGALVLVSVYDLFGLRRLPMLIILGAITSVVTWRGLKDADTRSSILKTTAKKSRDWRNIVAVMLPAALILVARAVMTVMLSTYFPAFLREGGASTWVSGAGMTLIFSAGVVGSFLAGSLSDSFGRGKVLTVTTLATSLFMLVFLRMSGWLQVPVLLLIGFFEISAMPVLMAQVQDNFSEDRAFINGMYLSMNFVITSLAIPFVGKYADLFDFRAAFQLGAYLLPLGLIGIWWLNGLKGKQLT